MTIVLEWSSAPELRAAIREAAPEETVVILDRAPLLDGALEAMIGAVDGGFDVVYGDELAVGESAELLRRPDPAPERLRCQYFWGRAVAYRARALATICDDLPGPGSSAIYALALRATAAGFRIGRVPVPLTAAAEPRRVPLDDDARAELRDELQRHLDSTGGGEVRSIGDDGIHDTRRPIRGRPLVSIVIPTRGVRADPAEPSLVENAVSGILAATTWDPYEFVVVHDDIASPEVLGELVASAGDRMRLVEWNRPFNFSGKVNLGVVHARGEYVLILNDDVELISPDWIESLLRLAQLPDAAMSGCMLLFEDGTIQHAGHHYWRGDTKHIGMYAAGDSPGELDGFRVEREVVGDTAACLLMPRALYLEVGGMSELLPGAFNDVDLCMKLLTAGKTAYWTPHARLVHFESKSRDARVRKWEVDIAWGRWGSRLHQPGFWPYPD